MSEPSGNDDRQAGISGLPGICGGPLRRGVWTGRVRDGIARFYGIRYARLSEPSHPRSAPVAASGQLDVDDMSDVPVFPQLPSRLESVTGPAGRLNPQDDEAFFLNVWAPVAAEGLPVLVFVHGGAWASGGGAVRWYRGERLAAEGMVVVTMNYRLGPAGHLGDEAGSSHRPFEDLLLALQWIKRWIAEFGGDPDRVTLAGQSAGAWYAWALSSLPEAEGLFGQAALLSIPQITPWTLTQRAAFTQRVVALAAADDEATKTERERLLCAGSRALGEMPCVPGAMPPMYLPAVSSEAARLFEGAANAAAQMHVGSLYVRITRHEMSVFLPRAESGSEAEEAVLRELRARSRGEAVPHHPGLAHWPPRYAETVEIASWLEFGRFSTEIASEARRRGRHVVWREFAAVGGPSHLGAVHCVDLPFQFGNRDDWADAPILEGWNATAFERLSGEVRSDLADFVHGRCEDADRILGDGERPQTA